MKANNRVFQFVKQHPLACIITLSAIILLGLFAVFGVQYAIDSPTYYIAWDYISSGKWDAFRTPSYPIFLGLCKELFGNYGNKVAVMVQIVVFLFSIRCFWELASHISSSRKVVCLVTALYGLIPGITDYTLILLTESFAICGVIFILVLLLRMHERIRVIDTIVFFLLQIFLIFLRPALLFLFVVMGVIALMWLYQKKIKQSLIILGSMLVTLCLLLGYRNEISKEYGFSSISCVSIVNDLVNINADSGLQDKIQSTSITLDDALKQRLSITLDDALKQRLISPDEYALYIESIPLKEKFVREVKKQVGIVGWYARAYYRILENCNAEMFHTYLFITLSDTQCPPKEILRTLEHRLPLKLHLFWYILILYTVLLLVKFWKSKSLNWFNWALCLTCWGQMAVMYIGADAQYTRLFLPAIPSMFLIIAQMASKIKPVLRVLSV